MRQLSPNWQIPSYAQDMLFAHADSQSAQVQGAHGEVDLSPSETLTLTWGQHGGALTQLSSEMDWTGEVRVGGFVMAVHLTEFEGLDLPIAILTVEGHPLKPTTSPYLTAEQRRQTPYVSPHFLDGIDDNFPEGITTWLVDSESPMLHVAQDSLSNQNRLHFYGQLATEARGWHRLMALPILLESVTVFGG